MQERFRPPHRSLNQDIFRRQLEGRNSCVLTKGPMNFRIITALRSAGGRLRPPQNTTPHPPPNPTHNPPKKTQTPLPSPPPQHPPKPRKTPNKHPKPPRPQRENKKTRVPENHQTPPPAPPPRPPPPTTNKPQTQSPPNNHPTPNTQKHALSRTLARNYGLHSRMAHSTPNGPFERAIPEHGLKTDDSHF